MNKYFYCYSWPLKEFLIKNGQESIVSGIHPDTGEPMVWRYFDQYDPYEVIDFKSLINPHINYANNTKLIKEVS